MNTLDYIDFPNISIRKNMTSIEYFIMVVFWGFYISFMIGVMASISLGIIISVYYQIKLWIKEKKQCLKNI